MSTNKENSEKSSVSGTAEEKAPQKEETINSSLPEAEASAADSEAETGKEKVGLITALRSKVNSAELLITRFLEENNVMARFIGLFLIFSSVVSVINYNKEPRIVPFDYNQNDLSKWHEFSNTVSFTKLFLFVGVLFAGVSVLRHFFKKFRSVKIDSYILVAGIMSFGISSLWRVENAPFSFGIIIVSLILLACFSKSDDFGELKKIPKAFYIVAVAVLATAVAVYVALTTIYRHKSFCSAVFDFGIFIQMYYSMITDFSLVTTCERGYELSHFAVHFSPIYYLLFPAYYLFPKPETLLTAQAVLVVSGVIPTYLICKKYKFSDILTFLFCVVYIFSSSVTAPCYYEFHENAFLPPLLMWFFYSIEKENRVLMYIMMVLVLMVKEDAALYIMCIALYLVFSRKNRKHGIIMFLATVTVFANVLYFMSKFGEGAMTSRTFGNLMQSYDGGFGDVIKTALSNPVYFISQCFTEEKLTFIMIILLPLLFTPFLTRKPSRMLIVIPFIIMNLASGYPYAYKFDFQYVFGTTACLIYASLINVADFDRKTLRNVLPLMTVATVLMFTANNTRRIYYAERYFDNKENYDRRIAYLEAIPEDASVLTTSFQVPHVANRKEVYTLDSNNANEPDTCDFVAIETDYMDDWKVQKIELLEQEGYKIFAEVESLIVIYVSPDYVIE